MVDLVMYARNSIRSIAYMPIIKRTAPRTTASDGKIGRTAGLEQIERQLEMTTVLRASSSTASWPVGAATNDGVGGGDASGSSYSSSKEGGGEDTAEQQQQQREQSRSRQQRMMKYSLVAMAGMFGMGTLSLLFTYGPAPTYGDQYLDKFLVVCRLRDALLQWQTDLSNVIY